MLTRPEVRRPSPLAVGTMVWLASELMFFGGLFASYFTIRAATPVWPPPGVHLEVVRDGIFTAILVASSFTMQLGARHLEKSNRPLARRWIILTIVLGSVFLANQLLEWFSLDFTATTDAYGSLFFSMTGFHGLHVLLGLAVMVGLLGRIVGPGPDPGDGPAAEVITFYWHFVDIVWLALFAIIFLLQ